MGKLESESEPVVREPWPSPKALVCLFLAIMAGVAVVGAVNWPKALSSFDPKSSYLEPGSTVMFIEDDGYIASKGDTARVVKDDGPEMLMDLRRVELKLLDGGNRGSVERAHRAKLVPAEGAK